MSAIVGPQPPFNNPVIAPQNFEPSNFEISALSLGVSSTVTTSVDHNFVLGQRVRIHIPKTYGTAQMNELDGTVTEIPSTASVIIDIDSTKFDAFIPSPSASISTPQISAIGDLNTQAALNSTGRLVNPSVEGSFKNIS